MKEFKVTGVSNEPWREYVNAHAEYFFPNALMTGEWNTPQAIKINPGKFGMVKKYKPCVRILFGGVNDMGGSSIILSAEEAETLASKLCKVASSISEEALAHFYSEEDAV